MGGEAGRAEGGLRLRGEADAEEAVFILGGKQGRRQLEGGAAGQHPGGVIVGGELHAVEGGEERRLAGVGGPDGHVVVGEGHRRHDGEITGDQVPLGVLQVQAQHKFAPARGLAAKNCEH
ncbi:hypothetical protein L7F22_058302 [Adiantum nelumboides]|nr:hypothetical protein [Adiantum nelumboides]